MTFPTTVKAILLIASLVASTSPFTMSETARVGGSGGRRTVTMDCGAGAYIVGATATGGKETPMLGFSLLHKVKFTCRAFSNTAPAPTTTQTAEAVGDKPVVDDLTRGSGDCPTTHVVFGVQVNAGFYIDRLTNLICTTASQAQTDVWLNVGGSSGTRAFMECPVGEALYKVEARVGDAIDSLKGFCRTFGSLSTVSVPSQIAATVSPKPTIASPIAIPINSSKSFSFTVSNYQSTTPSVLIGVTGETDPLGGALMNPPQFKIDLIDPSGTVVASKSFNNPGPTISGVTFRINANGGWKLRVTNLKTTIGTLNVKTFDVTSP
jgi:hypothetical protein